MPAPTHEPEVRMADVMAAIKSATEGIEARDKRIRAVEASINDLLKAMHRPGGGGDFSKAAVDERPQAIAMLLQKHHASEEFAIACDIDVTSSRASTLWPQLVLHDAPPRTQNFAQLG